MKMDFSSAQWLYPPKRFDISDKEIRIITDPGTDFWQRTYYGFRNDNAHSLLVESSLNFTFTTRVSFKYQGKFDQCGLIIYLDSDNWFKASVEYENDSLARLGSVVTNLGYSDWATTDIATPAAIWYRLSRRGPDFLIESCADGLDFKQMRIFHLHALGETTAEMGKMNPPTPAALPVRFGLYACSPVNASFEARFDHWKFEDCAWLAHAE
jgi:uncharacterized protein